MAGDTSVKVAVRIRPQVSREIIDMCHICTSVSAGDPQVWLGKDKAFTFDSVFDMPTLQEDVYNTCVKNLIDGCFEGYNATVFAYGQTGSGKTYTMGTGFDLNLNAEERGIVPRAVEHLFRVIHERQQEAREKGEPPPEFKVTTQFMELYNEEIIDLLDAAKESDERMKRSHIKIHEDSKGDIYTVGVTTRNVTSPEETLQYLKVGALCRTTASTNMNVQSSRSHAIFTIHVKQQRVVTFEPHLSLSSDESTEISAPTQNGEVMNEFETLTAKFHFVDLAGSERLKRTGATGDRAKEGISINCGLLALGNVISALGDKSRKVTHVPYRDSKLTRLLQDSLGGNSQTLMIACVSPSDRDFMETLNTLKYANRAKNIKNRVMVNQDKSSQTITLLRREIQQLQLELMEYKQGKRIVGEDGTEQINDMFHENTMLQTENNNLRTRIKALQETVERLNVRNSELLAEKEMGTWITSGESSSQPDITGMIQGYLREIEDLRAKLMESEGMCTQLRRRVQRSPIRQPLSPTSVAVSVVGQYDIGVDAEPTSVYELLTEAKRDVQKLKKKTKVLKETGEKESGVSDNTVEEDGEKEEKDEEIQDGIEENEEDESSETDTEDTAPEDYNEDLADLTCEISIKQKLIEELENSQRRLQTMRQHYEDKLQQLQNKIKDTELERDRVLANMTKGIGVQSHDKIKKVQEEFEKKIGALQSELKKMQSAKKEHANLMKNQVQYERQLKQLRQEVVDMKKAKVRLVNKMKDESQKHKMQEQRKNKEIAQLRKEGRKHENKIRTLEAEKRMKEIVLRRKQEEVLVLRKRNKPMSAKVAGKIGWARHSSAVRSLPFSPKVAKQKWQHLEKRIMKVALNKQSVSNVEREMEKWLQEREKLGHSLEKVCRKRDRAILDGKGEIVIRDLEDELENLKANIDYVHENISECQTSIMQMEESKESDDLDDLDVNSVLANLQMDEARYLLQKLLNMAINQSFQVAQKETIVKEIEAKLKQVVNSNAVQQQLLQHVLHQANEELYNYVMATVEPDHLESVETSRSSSPLDRSLSQESDAVNTDTLGRREKVRRRTATTQELLYPLSAQASSESVVLSVPMIEEESESLSSSIRQQEFTFSYWQKENMMTQSVLMPPPPPPVSEEKSIPRVISAPGSLKDMAAKFKHDPSPALKHKTYDKIPPEISPAIRRKNASNTSSTLVLQQNFVEASSHLTIPDSPPVGRRQPGDNVFSRLTSGTTTNNRKPDRGCINPYTGRPLMGKNAPLVCTYVAEGHSKAVLSVVATDDVLFSSSKDRTVKVWDLQTLKEIQTLGGHPNNVVKVRYCEYSRLAFSVSTAFVKVWDIREKPAHCVKTLSSSGLTITGPMQISTPSRTIQMPQGETQINDISLNQYGTLLFSAAGNIVRIWDLRMYHTIGRLTGGHQAAVMCLAVDDLGEDNNVVITGSKDHYIKVFEVMEGASGVLTPKLNLEPPHYDGIQSLAINGDYLFSGSRDMCIKKWDLGGQCLVQSLNQAHKDWICGLSFLPNSNTLVSCCRGGFMKLWSGDSCQLLAELKAHSAPINAIATNSSFVFTASNDSTVRLWHLRTLPEMSDFEDERL
ncbi:kinesin-like protein KIF21A isoform X2 [Limulus polyphemus]|uniref:Kinesin-like protein KIF21A isoform X2 n=1 Tax=Limulus polyphemus TaxID=6850 RepID=A0ABM1S243_LIMPO|nr:kinesin-like protein KIF21A isoform X2 [Limulus polyphemus]